MSTAPALNERLYCAGGAADSRISLAARQALKDQGKTPLVNHTCWESPCANSGRVTLPRPLSLSDFGNLFCPLACQRRAPQYEQTRRLLTNRPVLKLCRERVLFQRTTTRQQWIVQRLYNNAVNETVELRLLTVFQHVVDPTRVCTVADKNAAVAQLDLRPAAAD
jgi:hypothetical protein